jgi:hypothetical protein
MMYVLNSAVLTAFGEYRYELLELSAAQEILLGGEFTSAVGHAATADVLTQILGVPIPHNRINIVMQPGDQAVVFRLKERLPEGRTLTADEARHWPFELGLLTRML